MTRKKGYYGPEDLASLTKAYDLTDVTEFTDSEGCEVTSEDFVEDSTFTASDFQSHDLDEILEKLAYKWNLYVSDEVSDNCPHFFFTSDGELESFDLGMQRDFKDKVEEYLMDHYVEGYDFQSAYLTFDTTNMSIWKEIIKNSFKSIKVSVTFTQPYWEGSNIDDDDANCGDELFCEGYESMGGDKDLAYVNVELSYEYMN